MNAPHERLDCDSPEPPRRPAIIHNANDDYDLILKSQEVYEEESMGNVRGIFDRIIKR
jgi:hypothetical protein